jgi:hypothetical protein
MGVRDSFHAWAEHYPVTLSKNYFTNPMNALECRTLIAECMTPGIMYSMAVTIIYP